MAVEQADRGMVQAHIKKEVGKALGEIWSRLKTLAEEAEIKEEDHLPYALLIIGDIQWAANVNCDELRTRCQIRAAEKATRAKGRK